MTKRALREKIMRLHEEAVETHAQLHSAHERIKELKAELAECRTRVTRYAEEAMETREHLSPEPQTLSAGGE